jgi:hypothetical protein
LPQIAPFTFGEDEINFEDSATATCTITKGDQPLEIWWTLTDSDYGIDRNLSTGEGVVIMRNSQKLSVLNIDSASAKHRGNYTCFASNRAGTIQHSAFLSINGDCTNFINF